MEQLNKIISLVLGLVVVMILFGIITGRINLKGKSFLGLGSTQKNSVSITPTPSIKVQVTKVSDGNHTYQTQTNTSEGITYTPKTTISPISQIPSTGSPTLLLPFMSSSLLAGFYLRKKK